ncbi:MAG TPA: hypothetical protein EYP24_02220, partial [bacterium (Candidatus Stahlbacteria)]|nr:hypothetical protein [Candidatus Stahlbacteria bacterium]
MEVVTVAILGQRSPPLSYLTDSARSGDLVLVPIRDRIAYGVVLGLSSKTYGLKRIKRIVLRRFLNEDLLKTLNWLSKYYLAPIGDVIRTAVPKVILPEQIPEVASVR